MKDAHKDESYIIFGINPAVFKQKEDGVFQLNSDDCIQMYIKSKNFKVLTKKHYAQIFNHLKAIGLKLNININFGNYLKFGRENF